MSSEEYNKELINLTQHFAKLFFEKELEKGNTRALNPSADFDEYRARIIKAAHKCATILLKTIQI